MVFILTKEIFLWDYPRVWMLENPIVFQFMRVKLVWKLAFLLMFNK